MRFDLKTPCKNCPFRNDETRITFASRERAKDIEEQAYRRGFPCHKSAVLIEGEDSPDGESGGFVPGENTQHCIGYILMRLNDQGVGSPWPGIDNDEDLLVSIAKRIEYWKEPVFQSADEFFNANPPPARRRRKVA